MLKRTILLESKASLTAKNLQLLIKTEIKESSIPIKDVGYLVIDNPEVYLSITAIRFLFGGNGFNLLLMARFTANAQIIGDYCLRPEASGLR